MNKEALDKAVIENKGLLPEQAGSSNLFIVVTHHLDGSKTELYLPKEAFTQCAKELGLALKQDQSLTHSEEGLAHSDWFDYESQKALRLPDVGVNCIMGESRRVVVVAAHCFTDKVICSEEKARGTLLYGGTDNLKPLDHATRKADLEKKRVVDAVYNLDPLSLDKEVLNCLYEMDCLHLPANKD